MEESNSFTLITHVLRFSHAGVANSMGGTEVIRVGSGFATLEDVLRDAADLGDEELSTMAETVLDHLGLPDPTPERKSGGAHVEIGLTDWSRGPRPRIKFVRPLHPVSVTRFPSFRTQPLENLSRYQ